MNAENPRLTSRGSRSVKWLGVTNIVCGALLVLLQIAIIILKIGGGVYLIATGVWAGIFMIVTGSFGVASTPEKTKCYVIGCMVMSILSAVAAGLCLLFTSLSCVLYVEVDPNRCLDPIWAHPYTCSHRELGWVLQAIFLLVSLIEMVAAIWFSVLCCRSISCGPTAQNVGPQHYEIMEDQNNGHILHFTPAVHVLDTTRMVS